MIELGEVASAPGPAPEPTRRPWPRRLSALAALGLACLLAVAGSARPGPPAVRLLWSVPLGGTDGMLVDADAVYLQRIIADEYLVTAYDLAAGSVRWTWRADGPVGYGQAVPGAAMLLLRTDQGDETSVRQTVALDSRTGAELWRSPGDAQAVFGDTALMISDDNLGRPVGVWLLRLAEHTVVWRRDTPGAATLTVAFTGAEPTRVVTARRGRVEVFRYADGAPLATAPITWPDTGSTDPHDTDVSASGDHLIVNHLAAVGSAAEIYRLDDLSLRWRVASPTGVVWACATVICAADDAGIAGRDPDTGETLWRLDGFANALDPGRDRLVLDHSGGGRHMLIDLAGRPVGESAQGTWIWPAEQEDAVLVLRATTTPPGRTAISRWHLDTGRLDLLGAVDEVGDRCESAPRFLACVHGDRLDVVAVG